MWIDAYCYLQRLHATLLPLLRMCGELFSVKSILYGIYSIVLNGIQSRILPMQEKLSARVRSPCVFTHSHPLCFTSCHIAAPRTAGSERSVVSRGLKCEVSTMCNKWFTLVILVLKKGLCFDDGGLRISCHTWIMLKLFALLQALWLAACPSSGEPIRDFTGKGLITFAKPIVHAHIWQKEKIPIISVLKPIWFGFV